MMSTNFASIAVLAMTSWAQNEVDVADYGELSKFMLS